MNKDIESLFITVSGQRVILDAAIQETAVDIQSPRHARYLSRETGRQYVPLLEALNATSSALEGSF